MTEDELDASQRRVKDAFVAVESHVGLVALRRWRLWGVVVNAFRANERELLSLIEAPSRDEKLAIELIQNVRPTGVADAYLGEMYRLLHNYLASVKSLVDHSRNLLGQYENSSFRREYQQRVKALGNEPVVAFVQDLRNVLLHQQLPVVSVQVHVATPSSDPVFSLNFETDTLLPIDRLTKRAREYVRSHDVEKWPVRVPVEEYRS